MADGCPLFQQTKWRGNRERLTDHYSRLVVLNDGEDPRRAPINVTGFFSLWVPMVLGHTASKNGRGRPDQEWWETKRSLLSDSKVIVLKLPRREGIQEGCHQSF